MEGRGKRCGREGDGGPRADARVEVATGGFDGVTRPGWGELPGRVRGAVEA